MKILMVLTSHDQLGNTGRKTGFWLEEFAAPYFVFRDAGVDLTLTSPKGGQPPIDPKSDLPENQTPAMARFKQDKEAQKALSQTLKLSDMKSEDFDTIFYVGGHGPMWDLVDNPDSIALIESFYNSGKPVAAVCHSPAVFHRVMFEGAPLVKGKRVTGFTNGEEEAVHLTKVVPFLVEDELKRVGGLYQKAADWESFAIVDGRLVTGQNPASSTAAAKALITLLGEGAVTGAFAYFGGAFSTDELTPSRFADRFEEIYGVHTGFRRNHAKGLEFPGSSRAMATASVFPRPPSLKRGACS
jgi:putative intracellular protease/amidase